MASHSQRSVPLQLDDGQRDEGLANELYGRRVGAVEAGRKVSGDMCGGAMCAVVVHCGPVVVHSDTHECWLLVASGAVSVADVSLDSALSVQPLAM